MYEKHLPLYMKLIFFFSFMDGGNKGIPLAKEKNVMAYCQAPFLMLNLLKDNSM